MLSRTVKLAAALAALAVVSNVLLTARRSASYPQFWQERMSAAVQPGDFRLVALGDSAVQAIGADRPMDGFVGRIAGHVSAVTGRRVHVSNASSAGKIAGILNNELLRVDLRSADLVIVAESNDLESRTPLDRYRAELSQLVDLLPADRTIISDLPPLPGRDQYQAVLAEIADSRGIARADVASALGGRLDIFSWLPPHLNSTGYALWYGAFEPLVDRILHRPPP